ncbi:MAG: ATP-binding protein, partial [Thermoplasmata archaeon]|nr:ATP-binding protein [Thermoplasmata archaeon]
PIIVREEWWGTLCFEDLTGEREWSQAELDAVKVAAETFGSAIQRQFVEEELDVYRRHLEDLVQERTSELEESNAELEAFAYTVSHDLRAPLRAMYGFSQALLEDYADRLDADGSDYARRIVSASERMDALIQDLLVYSRLSLTEITPEPVSVKAVLNDIVVQLEPIIRERAATVSAADDLPIVLGNRPTLAQVLTNLITNSIKFTERGKPPVVRIWSEDHGPTARIWVEDNGIGIPEEYHEQIFRVFERLHGSDEYPGTGIGLAIVRKGVTRMNGRVGVESTPGEGSRFWIELQREERR